MTRPPAATASCGGATAADRITRYAGFYNVRNDIDSPIRNRQLGVSARLEHEMSWASLTSISAYQQLHARFDLVFNGVGRGDTCLGCQAFNIRSRTPTSTVTQDVRIGSLAASPIKWVAGVYYLHDDSEAIGNQFGQFGRGITPQTIDATIKTNSYAVFGQVTAPIGDSTNITGGLRYTIDTRNFTGTIVPLPGFPNSVTAFPSTMATSVSPNLPDHKRWAKLTYRAVIDHHFTPDIMGYLSANRGYKSGIYNINSLVNAPAAPEVLDAYEAGLKNQFFSRRVTLNLSGFLYNYKDVQLRAFDPRNGLISLLNAGCARLYGLDADFRVAATSRLTFSGGAEYLHARYTSFSPAPITTRLPSGANATNALGNATGNTLTRAPAFTAAVQAQYRLPTEIGDFFGSITYNHNSGFFWDPDNRVRQPAYNLVNASLSWTNPKKTWSVKGWINNLTNTQYYSVIQEVSADLFQPAAPRTYGVTLGLHL